jgi:hypothetical protein
MDRSKTVNLTLRRFPPETAVRVVEIRRNAAAVAGSWDAP